jgi:hypothetical protein
MGKGEALVQNFLPCSLPLSPLPDFPPSTHPINEDGDNNRGGMDGDEELSDS